MNVKQKKFVDAYIQSGGNATMAAIEAGYSKESAYSQGGRLLKNAEVAEMLKTRLAEMEEKAIAKDKEVLHFLTAVLRGEISEKIPSAVGTGKGYFHNELLEKPPSIAERLKAAQILSKYLGLDKPQEKEPEPITINIVSAKVGKKSFEVEENFEVEESFEVEENFEVEE